MWGCEGLGFKVSLGFKVWGCEGFGFEVSFEFKVEGSEGLGCAARAILHDPQR